MDFVTVPVFHWAMRTWNIWSCFFINVRQHVCSFRCKLSSLFTFVFLKCLFVFWASRIFRVQNRFCHAELLKNNRLGQYGKEKLLNWCKPSNLFKLRLILIFSPSKMLWKSNVLFYFAWTPPWTLDFMKKKLRVSLFLMQSTRYRLTAKIFHVLSFVWTKSHYHCS